MKIESPSHNLSWAKVRILCRACWGVRVTSHMCLKGNHPPPRHNTGQVEQPGKLWYISMNKQKRRIVMAKLVGSKNNIFLYTWNKSQFYQLYYFWWNRIFTHKFFPFFPRKLYSIMNAIRQCITTMSTITNYWHQWGKFFKILIWEMNNRTCRNDSFIDFSQGYAGRWAFEDWNAEYHENDSDNNHENYEYNTDVFFQKRSYQKLHC